MSETNPSMPPNVGQFSWNELVTNDAKAAETFYTKLFGWQTQSFSPAGMPPGAPPYTVFKTDANVMGVGGMAACTEPGFQPHWQAYVVVKSADATLVQATQLGAKMLMPAMDVPGVGRIALIQDPQGAVVGLHQLLG